MTLGFTDVGSTAYRTRRSGAVLGAAYPPMPGMICNQSLTKRRLKTPASCVMQRDQAGHFCNISVFP